MNKIITRLKNTPFFVALIAFAVIFSANSTQALAAGGFNGAIFTSKSDGTATNQNLYDSKNDVYLNGGPQNLNAAGLPDGTYYFQVTNPSGSVLLSTDPASCRQLIVVGGKVAGATGSCQHANGVLNSANGSTPVQLVPFADTPNAGGEYKVWLIRQATTTVVNPDGISISFNNSNSKSDNFKIKTAPPCTDCGPQTVTISGHKFYDTNVNGINNNEPALQGVKIKITLTVNGEPQQPVYAETDASGYWSYSNVPAGADYSVEEVLPTTGELGSYWVQTAPVPDSNNFQGYTGTANSNISDLDFGDVCFHPASGGLTLGFWSNKNGEKTMKSTTGVDTSVYPSVTPDFPGIDADLYFLRRLNLKGEAVNKKAVVTQEFDPTTYAQFNTWILSANAYNMSYMLSAQLAATSLDVRHKFLSDSQIVDARNVCNAVGSCLGFISIGEVRQLANESLDVVNGGNKTVSGDPLRDSQELMKKFLDDVNNNRLPFASSSPCGVVYDTPPAP